MRQNFLIKCIYPLSLFLLIIKSDIKKTIVAIKIYCTLFSEFLKLMLMSEDCLAA